VLLSTVTSAYAIEAAKYGPMDSSEFVSQTVPTTMTAGHTYSVSVTFKNVGLSTWTSVNGFSLQSRNPAANTIWGPSSVALAPADSIAGAEQDVCV